MSTLVMSQCWPLQMPPVPKGVLISLADNANDQGVCWPSLATISERTCYGRTAVIGAIRWLEEHGALHANRDNGRHTSYRITPGSFALDGKPTEPVRHADRCATRTSPPRGPVRHVNQSATRTGTPREPVRHANGTSPPRVPDPSATRTGPVRHADTNRQEPSLEPSVEPSLSPPTTVAIVEADERASEPGPVDGTFEPEPKPPATDAPEAKPAPIPLNARAAILMRERGAPRVNPSHPALVLAIAEGVTPEALADTVTEALSRNPPIGDPFLWAVKTARNRRAEVTQRPPVEVDRELTKGMSVPTRAASGDGYSAPRGTNSRTSDAIRAALDLAEADHG